MNLNIAAYLVYSSITILIIFWVGRMFYINGRVFILRLFHNNAEQTDATNNIILVAYYLFNIGYAVIQFKNWVYVDRISLLISSVAGKTALLISILAVTHYFNILLIYLLSKRSHKFSHFKK